MSKSKNIMKEFIKQLPLQIMTLPGIIFLIIFSYIPMYGIIIAFKNTSVLDATTSGKFVGLMNFKLILSDMHFWQATINTACISLIKIFIGFPVPIILAILIFELRDGRFKKVTQTVSYLPHFISWIIFGGMLVSWLGTNGLLNNILVALGILKKPISFLIEPKYYYWIAALSDIWKEAGWGTILYLAGMASIDTTVYEAAVIDGASRLKRIRYITIPGIQSIIALQFMMSLSSLFSSNFDQSMVLQNALNIGRSEVLDTYVFRTGITQGNFSYATAVGLLLSVASLILLVASNLATKKFKDIDVF